MKIEKKVPQNGGIEQEFLTLKTIEKHAHIIEYKEYGKNAERVRNIGDGIIDNVSYLALELALNKTILDYLLSKQGYIGEKWTRYWFRQILTGLIHMKNKGFSHLDIKCENILLNHNLTAKLGDFGFAQPNSDGINMVTGSEFHKGPEICYKRFPYDGEKADVFSLAVVLFAMQMKAFPFERVQDVIYSRKYKLYIDGDYDAFWPSNPPVSAEFKDLFMRMIIKDPSQRLSLTEVFNHPWTQIKELPTDQEILDEATRVSTIR